MLACSPTTYWLLRGKKRKVICRCEIKDSLESTWTLSFYCLVFSTGFGVIWTQTAVRTRSVIFTTPVQWPAKIWYMCIWRIHLGFPSATFFCFFNFSFVPISPQVTRAFHIVYETGLNEYALYLDCEGQGQSHRGYERTMSHLFKNYRKHPLMHKVSIFPFKLTPVFQILVASQHQWLTSLFFLMKALYRASPSMSLGEVPPCINSTAQMNWLNRGDVRKALHIPDVLPPWDICRCVLLKSLIIGWLSLIFIGHPSGCLCWYLPDGLLRNDRELRVLYYIRQHLTTIGCITFIQPWPACWEHSASFHRHDK